MPTHTPHFIPVRPIRWLAALSLLVLTVPACGRVFPGGDGGTGDGGPSSDALILPDGAVQCELLDPDRCAQVAGCEVYSGCPSCDGRVSRSCGPAGRAGGPCAEPRCFDCHELSEENCRQSPQCVVVPGCQDCDGNVDFLGCYNADEPIPAVDCAAPICETCDGLGEQACEASPDCYPYYDCGDCSGNVGYLGCFSNDSPPPPVACPDIDCAPEPCSVKDEQACAASPECHGVYQTASALCDCDAPGCCTSFERCAAGPTADCQGPAFCESVAPECEGPFVLAFTGGCYEGCVLKDVCSQ